MNDGIGFFSGFATGTLLLLAMWMTCDIPVRPGVLETHTRGDVECDPLRLVNGNLNMWSCTVPLGELRIPSDSVRAVRWP